MGKIKLAELQKMLKKRSAEQKRSDSLKAESVSTTLYNKQLLSKSRQLDIDKKIKTQAQPGYTQIPTPEGGMVTLEPPKSAQEFEERKVLIAGGGAPRSRADSSLFYPATALSKKPTTEEPFDPEKDKLPFEYRVKGRKGKEKYQIKGKDGWIDVTKDYYDAQRKGEKERSVERKKYLNKPTGRKTFGPTNEELGRSITATNPTTGERLQLIDGQWQTVK